MWRVRLWVPCWMVVGCTSATPPPEATGAAKEAEPAPAPEVAAAPVCEKGATLPCYPGPQPTEGVGTCKPGTQRCTGAAWGECEDAVLPAADEDCRTPHDEDCDGRSDDCPAAEVTLALAFTRDRELRLDDWGGGLGIVGGPIFWVVEPGGKVVDPWEEAALDQEPAWERQLESDEAMTAVTGGAWPGALLRTYETGGTRAGYIMEQERWDGSQFAGELNTDELLQWRYEEAVPWRDGHAVAVRRTYQSYEAMEQLDASTLEYGSITGAEQRALQRKVDRLLGKAVPRLVIVAAGDPVAWEPAFGVFGELAEASDAAGEDEAEVEPVEAVGDSKRAAPKGEEAGAKEAAAPKAGEADAKGAAAPGGDDVAAAADSPAEGDAEAAPELPQPPQLPGELRSFVVLSDGAIAMLGGESRMWSWKPGGRRWTAIEPPPGFTFEGRDVSLHAGPAGELLLRDCDGKQATGTLRRRSGSSWSDVGLPTSGCPTALASTPDGTRWMISGEQLWQRKVGDAEPWKRVAVPTPWKPRQVVSFDGQVWIAAEGEGGKRAVLVDRAVPATREFPAR